MRYALKGNICFSESPDTIRIVEQGYVLCEDGICKGILERNEHPEQEMPCYDYGNRLIIPGLVDLHVHAPQYAFRGLGMDLELIDWLNTHTFKEEEKYNDMEYAKKAYDIFTEDLIRSATTRACIFGTVHTEATWYLMKKLEEAGFEAYVGKVNMDRNCPDTLCEKSAEQSVSDTEKWILKSRELTHVKPILTPRFIPSCTDDLMEGLSGLQKKYQIPVQSHLSENIGEIRWVQELCPNTSCYGQAYDQHGMFGGNCPTIMAHCIYSGEEEMDMMRRKGVFIAHCPESNANLSSGIAPIKKYMEMGMKAGLGSDVAAGSDVSIFKAMAMAIQCSKLRWRLADASVEPLKVEEAFYLATKGGGEFFGKVGSFLEGHEFDAIVIDDTDLRSPYELNVRERLERLIYLGNERHISAKFIKGKKLFDVCMNE